MFKANEGAFKAIWAHNERPWGKLWAKRNPFETKL